MLKGGKGRQAPLPENSDIARADLRRVVHECVYMWRMMNGLANDSLRIPSMGFLPLGVVVTPG